jgi:hypothetical protein
MLTVGDARRGVEQRKLSNQKAETARFQRLLKKETKALFTQFDKAAAKARERIRSEKLLEAYDQDV